MRFNIKHFRTSFLVSLLPSDTVVNYREMKEGEYDWKKEIVFDSLTAVKKDLRRWVNEEKLSESERYYLRLEITDLSIESLIDNELELYSELEKELNELKKKTETVAA